MKLYARDVKHVTDGTKKIEGRMMKLTASVRFFTLTDQQFRLYSRCDQTVAQEPHTAPLNH